MLNSRASLSGVIAFIRKSARYAQIALYSTMLWTANYSAYASITINGTRVIYLAQKAEVTVNLSNRGDAPVLIQNWIDAGDDKIDPGKMPMPFIVTPPINRVDPGRGQALRISYVGVPALPKDKESVFWLNVMEIAAKQDKPNNASHLDIAFRTRIKLFYRPEGLKGDANRAPELLAWKGDEGGMQVNNPSPYYVSLGTITYNEKGTRHETEGVMIAPGETRKIPLKNIANTNDINQLTYTAINDYGGVTTYKAHK
ncbi:fimbria/pilus periplasmic chaperone [Citrobacter amalonaticus]|uniref:fimbria/pilus periplasmic chaperone n=1 Tax=Citrobacter amalonaticus TaxID=35703 RepID=UPI00339C7876